MELYDAKNMPLSSDPKIREAQERYDKGEHFLTLCGSDQRKIKKELGGYKCKSNYCYRAISPETYELYRTSGFICDNRPNSNEYMEMVDEDGKIYTNNSGIDWYLGGAAPGKEYGMIVIECPADRNYFQPAIDNGTHMTIDPTVRHMKSSPKKNPIPFSMITNVFDYRIIKEQEMVEKARLREQQLASLNQSALTDENMNGNTI